MDERDFILEMRCDEAGGSVVRCVRLVQLTREKLQYFYTKLKKFDVLFNDESPNDFIAFAGRFLTLNPDKTVKATGLIWEVDDVGILFMTGITDYAACVHFTFWDRRLKGREPLIKAMIQHAMERYGFERLEVSIGLYAKAALYAVERIGFIKEGRLRKVMRYKGEWYDANIYSVLREEVELWDRHNSRIKESRSTTYSPNSPKVSLSSSVVQEDLHRIS